MPRDKKIKQLDIVFENCEVCTLMPDMIVMCGVNDIKHNIGINYFQYTEREVYTSSICDELFLVINQKGLSQKSSLFSEDENSEYLEQRLKFRDITYIDIIYEDGTNDYIGVRWEDYNGNEYMNKLQNVVYTDTSEYKDCIAVIINKEPLTLGQLEEEYGI